MINIETSIDYIYIISILSMIYITCYIASITTTIFILSRIPRWYNMYLIHSTFMLIISFFVIYLYIHILIQLDILQNPFDSKTNYKQ